MSMFRRRRTRADSEVSPAVPSPTSKTGRALTGATRTTGNTLQPPAAPPPTTSVAADLPVPPRVERALIALTAKMQHCLERLESLEHKVEELTEASLNTPSHSDVLEVRLHSAKLAAELARTTVELRGEIGIIHAERRRQNASQNAPASAAITTNPQNQELEQEIEQLDISPAGIKGAAEIETSQHPAGQNNRNWTQTA